MASTTERAVEYDGSLNETEIAVYHHVSIAHTDNIRAKKLGFGKKSGRERLTRALRIALRRYLDDLDAGRVEPPKWND